MGKMQNQESKIFATMRSSGAVPGFSEGGSDRLLPTLSNCYCCLTSPFFTRKSMVKIFAFS